MKDNLFRSFSKFKLRKTNTYTIVGGGHTTGGTNDNGCTQAWTDDCNGNTVSHDDDNIG